MQKRLTGIICLGLTLSACQDTTQKDLKPFAAFPVAPVSYSIDGAIEKGGMIFSSNQDFPMLCSTIEGAEKLIFEHDQLLGKLGGEIKTPEGDVYDFDVAYPAFFAKCQRH